MKFGRLVLDRTVPVSKFDLKHLYIYAYINKRCHFHINGEITALLMHFSAPRINVQVMASLSQQAFPSVFSSVLLGHSTLRPKSVDSLSVSLHLSSVTLRTIVYC